MGSFEGDYLGSEPYWVITEIANLVPACGKCNQSKGKTPWRTWMVSSAKLSPKSRSVVGIEDKIARLSKYEQWREPTRIPIEDVIGQELWRKHKANWSAVLDLLKKSQILAKEIRQAIEKHRLTLEARKPSI
jgi:hypothetical protein